MNPIVLAGFLQSVYYIAGAVVSVAACILAALIVVDYRRVRLQQRDALLQRKLSVGAVGYVRRKVGRHG